MNDREIFIAVKEGRVTKEEAVLLLKANILQRKATGNNEGRTKPKNSIEDKVKLIICNILHLDKDEIDSDIELVQVGIDSINGVEITKSISNEFNINLDATVLYDYGTINKLVQFIEGLNNKKDKIEKVNEKSIEKIPSVNKKKVKLDNNKNNSPEKIREKIVLNANNTNSKNKEVKSNTLISRNINSTNNIEIVKEVIEEVIRKTLHISEDIERDVALNELGVDSISSVEIIRDLNKTFNLSLDAVILYDYSTIEELSKYLITLIKDEVFESFKKKLI